MRQASRFAAMSSRPKIGNNTTADLTSSVLRLSLCGAERNQTVPIDRAMRVAELCCELLRELVDDRAVLGRELFVPALGVVAKRLDDASVELVIVRDQRPEVLATELYVVAFVWLGIPSIAAAVHGDYADRPGLPVG